MPPKTKRELSSPRAAPVQQYQRRRQRSQPSHADAAPARRQSSRLQAFGRQPRGLPPATNENPIEIAADDDDTPHEGMDVEPSGLATGASPASTDRSTTEEYESASSTSQSLGTEDPATDEPQIEQPPQQGLEVPPLGEGGQASADPSSMQMVVWRGESQPLTEGDHAGQDPSTMQIVIWQPKSQPSGKDEGQPERSGARVKRVAKRPPRPPRLGKGKKLADTRRKRPRTSSLGKEQASFDTRETAAAAAQEPFAETSPLGKGQPTAATASTETSPENTSPLGEGQAPTDQPATDTATTPSDSSDPPILRTRPRVGGKPTIPPDSALGGYLKFFKKSHIAQYAQIRNRSVASARRMDIATLDHLGISAGVQALIDNIGWTEFFQLNEPVYVELVKEFYATFEYTKPKPLNLDAPSMSFRLLTEKFTLSINEFTTSLGLDDTAIYSEIPNDFSGTQEYAEMCNDPEIIYNSSKSKDVCIIDPCIKYVHRFLAYNFSCRMDNPGLVSKTELFFLSSMVKGRRVHLGYWLATQFHNALKTGNRPLILGHIITHFAKRQHLIPSKRPLFSLGLPTPLDMRSLEDMKLIRIVQGTSSFVGAGPVPTEGTQGQEDVPSSAASTLLTALAEDVADIKRELSRQATQLHRVEGIVQTIAEKMGITGLDTE